MNQPIYNRKISPSEIEFMKANPDADSEMLATKYGVTVKHINNLKAKHRRERAFLLKKQNSQL